MAFQQCKNFEHRLRFDQVTDSKMVGTFLRHSVVVAVVNSVCHSVLCKLSVLLFSQ